MSEQEAAATPVAVLEERMKTMQAEYKTDIAMLAAESAKRETRMLVTLVATLIGSIGLSTATLSMVIA